MVFVILDQIVVAGSIDGVVECGPPAIAHPVDSRGEQRGVVGKILHHLALPVEAYDESLVKIEAHGVLQKTDGSILLEFETASNRTAGIDQKSEFDGQVDLAPEIDDGLRRLVIVEDGEVFLVQVAHKLAMFVGGDE